MNTDEFDNLIQRAIDESLDREKGDLTWKATQALYYYAFENGVKDLGVINARIDSLVKERLDGHISIKCPVCGRMVPYKKVECSCGYKFPYVKVLSKYLDNVGLAGSELAYIDRIHDDPRSRVQARKSRVLAKKKFLIYVFPFPETKEDITEFLSDAVPLTKPSKFLLVVLAIIALLMAWTIVFPILVVWMYRDIMSDEKELKEAWRDKCLEVIEKGRRIQGDEEFTLQLDKFEKKLA